MPVCNTYNDLFLQVTQASWVQKPESCTIYRKSDEEDEAIDVMLHILPLGQALTHLLNWINIFNHGD